MRTPTFADDPWPRWFEPLGARALDSRQALALARLGADDEEWRRRRRDLFPVSIALAHLAKEPELRQVIHRVGLSGHQRILDIGAGPGIMSRLLVDEGAAHVVCADSDEAFDAVWWGDLWVPEAMDELRRVTREGGRIIAKLTGAAPPLRYASDRAFNARLVAAELATWSARYREPVGDAVRSLAGQLDDAGFSDRFSVAVERFSPLSALDRAELTTTFGSWVGPHLRTALDAEDWERLERMWDPDDDAYLFTRSDLHLLTSLLIAVA